MVERGMDNWEGRGSNFFLSFVLGEANDWSLEYLKDRFLRWIWTMSGGGLTRGVISRVVICLERLEKYLLVLPNTSR